MPKKQASPETAAAGSVIPRARAAKPKTTSPATASEVVTTKSAARPARSPGARHSKSLAALAAAVNPQEEIARIAYGYWEARGYQHGSSEEDWLRAEKEFLGS